MLAHELKRHNPLEIGPFLVSHLIATFGASSAARLGFLEFSQKTRGLSRVTCSSRGNRVVLLSY